MGSGKEAWGKFFAGEPRRGKCRSWVWGTGAYWKTQYLKARCSEFCCFALKRHFVVAKGFIIIFRFSIEESLLCIRA